jgi:hypothetical protein
MNDNVEETADDRAKNSRDYVAKSWGNQGKVRHSIFLLFFPKHQVFQKRVVRGEARNRKPGKAIT